MLLYIMFGLMVLWSFFPILAINIGPVPPFMLFFIMLSIATLQNYRNVFSIPKWYLFVGVGLALLFSQINAIKWEDTLKTTVATATVWGCIPFVGIWLRERKYRMFVLYLMVLSLLLYNVYIFIYRGELQAGETNFGFLYLSLDGAGMTIALAYATILFFIIDKHQPTFVRVGTLLVILFSMYTVLFYLGSRNSLLGILLSVLVIVYLTNREQVSKMIFIGIISTTILMGGTYISYTQQWLPPHVNSRLFKLVHPQSDGSLMVRIAFLKKSWEMFKDYPLTGGGWMNYLNYTYKQSQTVYSTAGYQYQASRDDRWPHSNYSRFLGETGLPGITMYIWTLIWLFRSIPWKIDKNNLVDTGSWMWFPIYLFISGFIDVIGYFPLLLLALLYGKILEQSWEPDFVKSPNHNYYSKINVVLPGGQS